MAAQGAPSIILPEWMWQLSTFWVSSKLYQIYREGIREVFWAPSSAWTIQTKRRSFNINYKLAAYQESCGSRLENQVDLLKGHNPYQYDSLPSQESLRLLHLLPGNPATPIQVCLTVHHLEDVPRFEALSYVWGVENCYTLSCGTNTLTVRENLFDALHALRQENAERLLWIDAVCINQEDLSERSSQVKLMRHIYKKSERVLIWLGGPSMLSQEAIRLLSALATLAQDEGAANGTYPFTTHDLSRLNLPESTSPVWQAVDRLFWREWFTRVWIIQELASAKEAVVWCGADFIPWEKVSVAARYISRHSLTAITQIDPHRVLRLHEFREAPAMRAGSVLHILLSARDTYSTDDRDKIFALLGLVLEDSHFDFPIDYALPVEEVYTSFARYCIEKHKTLDILSATEDRAYRLKSCLPTWVPDWEVHPPSAALHTLPHFRQWRACGEAGISVRFSGDGEILIAKGVILDRIDRIGNNFLEYVPLPGAIKFFSRMRSKTLALALEDIHLSQRFRQWEKLASNLGRYPNGEDVMDAFVCTLVAGATMSNAGEDLRSYYHAWCRYWIHASRSQGEFINESYTRVSEEDRLKATCFMELHHRAAYVRRFFTTKGGYMGLCPSISRSGDLVVILFGGRTPYILRRGRNGLFRFIGECYVYGLMNAEAMASPCMKPEDIHIR